MLPQRLSERLATLAEDNQSGASWLITEAASAVATHLASCTGSELRALLPDLVRSVAETRTSMAPFWNLANALALAGEAREDEALGRQVAEVCAAFRDGVPQRIAGVAQRAAAHLGAYPRLLTHSLSHTVVSTLETLYEAGGLEPVVCTEGAPNFEGRAVAVALANAGMDVVLTTDAGAYPVLEEVDAVLVGADALGTGGLRNKTGTFGLAAAAAHCGIPVVVLCDTTKLLPARFAETLPVAQKDPDEVWDRPPGGVTVVNYYFDLTPLDLLTTVITEHDVLDATGVRALLAALSVARVWNRPRTP